MGILEFLTNFDWLALPINLASGARHAHKHGDSLLSGVIGTNSEFFFAPLYGKWNGKEIEKLLKQQGIDMWGWECYDGQQYFQVHKDDAGRAAAVLRSAGVTLQNPR